MRPVHHDETILEANVGSICILVEASYEDDKLVAITGRSWLAEDEDGPFNSEPTAFYDSKV
jgi:hypothetical protein